MHSNTISIVHSNFRRKEPLYLSRPYFCHEQTPVLGTYSFLYYFQQKISQALHHEALSNWFGSENETESFTDHSSHSVALCSLGLPAVDHLALRVWEGFLLGALVNGAQSGAGQGREPRPGLGFLPWPVTEKYLSKPPLAIFSFAFTLSSMSRSSVMKWLWYFLLKILKKTKSLKPVSVHDRNKAWI